MRFLHYTSFNPPAIEKKKGPIKARQSKEATMKACIDLTATSSIAGQALEALSSQDQQVVKDKISKT
jgi:hypothetical protein